MATGLPSQTQVIELLGGEFARAGYEIDDVIIDTRSCPPRIAVIIDGDIPPDLDAIAALSRSASALLDGRDGVDFHYVLEVSSPGAERSLSSEKHFRRAQGRKVAVELTDGSQLTARVGQLEGNTVALVVRAGGGWAVRQIPLSMIAKAVVQIEFSTPHRLELELTTGRAAEAEAST
ncbi:MAG: ribosome maturation factor RimP [Mycobacteriaceae bacterium]|nr:ribosome maturation factor RimP [Mycobacteriaceae bacterium]